MNKNAYEIRLEVLNLAYSELWNIYNEKLNVLREHDNRSMEYYYRKFETDTTIKLPTLLFTKEAIDDLFPSSADIKKRAVELYSFVEGM